MGFGGIWAVQTLVFSQYFNRLDGLAKLATSYEYGDHYHQERHHQGKAMSCFSHGPAYQASMTA